MERQGDHIGGDSQYKKWVVAVHSWEWRATIRRNIDVLLAVGTAVILIVTANYGLQSYFPPELYLEMARTIQHAGYGLPETIPHMTDDGLPFAYPPLAFYILAILEEFTPLTYLGSAVTMTWVGFVLHAVLSVLLARELFRGRSQWHTVIASVLLVVTPSLFVWHLLPPAGSVRLLGRFFFMAGLIFGLKLFRDSERSALIPAFVCFSGTILSHPLYVPMFGLSFILLYVTYDRSATGLLWGTTVALGGFLVTAPWWGLIISRHGVDIFQYAAASHEGIGRWIGIRAVVEEMLPIDGRFTTLRIWSLGFIGSLYCLLRRRWFLPLWLIVIGIIYPYAEFIAFIEALVVTVAICEIVLPAVRDHRLPDIRIPNWCFVFRDRLPDSISVSGNTVVAIVVAIILLGALGTGVVYAVSHQRTGPTQEFYDVAEWAQEETPHGATFVSYTETGVLAFYAERTVLNVPWGTEWQGEGDFERYRKQNRVIRGCYQPSCLSYRLSQYRFSPDFIVIPNDRIDIAVFSASPRYQSVYSNTGYTVYRVLRPPGPADSQR